MTYHKFSASSFCVSVLIPKLMISLQVELYLWQNAFRILFVNSFQLYCSHIMLNYVQIYLIDRKNVQKGSGRTQHNVQ